MATKKDDAVYYGPNVRVRWHQGDRRTFEQDHEVVEEMVDGIWVERRRYRHMSDDYALTNARDHAQSLARKHIGKQ